MKRFFGLLLALAVVTLSIGAQPVTIGFVSPDQGASTQARIANKLEQVAKQEGWKISVSSATGSWEKMANIVEDYVSKKVSVIVIAMGQSTSITPALEAAKKAKIPVLAIDSEFSDLLTADILTNNWEMGAKISTYLVDRLNHKGNIVAFKFDQFYGTRYRGEILDTILSEEPNIKVLDTHYILLQDILPILAAMGLSRQIRFENRCRLVRFRRPGIRRFAGYKRKRLWPGGCVRRQVRRY